MSSVYQQSSVDSPIAAFRAWRVRGGRLHALTGEEPQEWLPGATIDARCDRPGRRVPHVAPAPGCRCGAYAVDSLATLDRVLGSIVGGWPWSRRNIVEGAVQLWGGPGRPVLVGEVRGRLGLQYRAPYMRIVALARSPQAERVSRSSGLPLVARKHLELVARERAGVQLKPAAAATRAMVTGPPWTQRSAESRSEFGNCLRGLMWGLRHIAPPVLICSVLLVLWAVRPVIRYGCRLLGGLLTRSWGWAGLVVVGGLLGIHLWVSPPVQALLLHAAGEWLRLLAGLVSIAFAVLLVARWVLGDWLAWRRTR